MAKSSSIGGIFAELTLKDSKFSKGLKGSSGKLKAFAASAAKYGAMASAAFGTAMIAGTKRIISMGGELSDLSAQTGIAVSDLMKIQQAYKDNGKSADSAGKDINKMQRAIYEASQLPGSSVDYFADMNMSAEELMEMSAADQFYKIAKGIQSIENPTKRAALAMDIFGRSGGELLTVFAGSDLESVNRTLGEMPVLMQQFANELDYADDLLGRLPNKSDQFFTGFSVGVLEHIVPSLETIDGFEFTSIGKSLGDSLGKAIKHAAFLTNVLFDTLAGKGFSESIDRYSAAFDEVEREYEEKKAEREKAADEDKLYQEARTNEHRNAPDYIDPVAAYAAAREMEHRTAPDFVDPESKKITEIIQNVATPEFDSYRSRGLSLSANPAANDAKKQLDVQVKILRIIEGLSKGDGQLNWT